MPSDGSSLGNQALAKAISERIPGVSEEAVRSVREELVEESILAKGKGRGGSVSLVSPSAGDDEDANEDEDDNAQAEENEFELAVEEEGAVPTPRRKSSKKASPRKSSSETQVLSYRHPDKRVNNPEVGMVHPENDPDQPKTKWAYDPHIDPSLQFDSERSRIESLIDDALGSGDPDIMRDALAELKRLQEPYLNWTGKAERTSFDVDTVSLHVHERIDPASILSTIRKRLKNETNGGGVAFQPGLFDAPFENLPLRQALDFYKHEKNWSNRLIAGDSLLVMNSLLQKESMAGQVHMIYFDPPYGIKYGSNFQPFTNKREVKDGADADLTQEPEMIKAFRDTWELGIHSYLTYLRDRLTLAKELLREGGSVFVQISDENLHHVREVLDEVFGADSFVSLITYSTTGGFSSAALSRTGDYVIWYARNKEKLKYNQLYVSKDLFDAARDDYDQLELNSGGRRPLTKEEKRDPALISNVGRLFTDSDPTSQGEGAATINHEYHGKDFHPGEGNHWKAPVPHGMRRLSRANRFQITPRGKIRYVRYLNDFGWKPINNAWFDIAGAVQDRSDPKVYVVQTSNKIIERCLLMTTEPGDLVFDPTCGSGTTAFVAEKWGRRWITCDTSRVAVTLAKQRLMTASYDYYALRYPHEGLKGGFIYKTAPHVTLKSIANNPDIDDIYDQTRPAVEVSLAALNLALKKAPPFTPAEGGRKGEKVSFTNGGTLHDWELPFDQPAHWPEGAKSSFEEFHKARQVAQRKIDHSIAERAEPETLYDKPEIDPNKLRITGPFSVEAVPNPTVFSLDEAQPIPEANVAIARSGETSRQAIWRDELIKSGIRGRAGQMFRISELETIPGVRHLHATGAFTDTGDRVVVSFGPEHAALEQRQVELALTEAEKLRPAPKFVVFCAFAFDPEAAKDIDEVNWPGVTLLKAQMNPDLLTEDLRKARSSNQSFWLMGQPDIDVRKRDDAMWEVEVNGFDYFDPKAGELVSGGKGKIAMWLLDTDYDQRSLFPHQVFFPISGKKDGWNRLKKNIKAELDEDLMEQFHGTVSLPFNAGDNKRVAIKIVDDRGIESLKIVALDD
jgi:adenine-specific DNA-methyltransferase